MIITTDSGSGGGIVSIYDPAKGTSTLIPLPEGGTTTGVRDVPEGGTVTIESAEGGDPIKGSFQFEPHNKTTTW